jgi:hypothetical protein
MWASPAGFQKTALKSSAKPTNAPPIATALGPIPFKFSPLANDIELKKTRNVITEIRTFVFFILTSFNFPFIYNILASLSIKNYRV